jgi:mycothiol synthase
LIQAGERRLEIFAYEYNTIRQQLLTERGYMQTTPNGVIRRLRFADHTRELAVIAPGYTLRTTNPEDLADCQHIADLLNAAFGRTFHAAGEYQNFTRLAPCFRREADLVAVAPDGSFAAYVGVPYDAVNRHATFEP